MKFLHSPSSSSSTSDTRHNYTITSCFPGVLRRLLGFHSLSTLPFDPHIQKSYENSELDELHCASMLKGNPGIVAKLMGLDTMPAGNSIHEWRQLRLQKKVNYVLEAPSFVELENEKFIILSFEGDGKDKELQLNSSKSRKGLVESKEKARNKKNQEIPISQSLENDGEVAKSSKLLDFNMNSKKSCDTDCAERVKFRKNKPEKAETESDSENSSPVSVLEFPDHHEASHSGKEDPKSKNSNSRRKLREDLDKNAPSPSSSPRSSCNSMDDGIESSRNGKRYVGSQKNNFVIGNFHQVWEEICKMAERDVMDSIRVKIERWKGEDYEEIGSSLELQILDQLILELVTII